MLNFLPSQVHCGAGLHQAAVRPPHRHGHQDRPGRPQRTRQHPQAGPERCQERRNAQQIRPHGRGMWRYDKHSCSLFFWNAYCTVGSDWHSKCNEAFVKIKAPWKYLHLYLCVCVCVYVFEFLYFFILLFCIACYILSKSGKNRLNHIKSGRLFQITTLNLQGLRRIPTSRFC